MAGSFHQSKPAIGWVGKQPFSLKTRLAKRAR
jgi:hypothetical protein